MTPRPVARVEGVLGMWHATSSIPGRIYIFFELAAPQHWVLTNPFTPADLIAQAVGS